MAAISGTNSATPSLQATLGRVRLEQARREVAQAEANAQSLRAQADDQERVAEQAHRRVYSLEGNTGATVAGDRKPASGSAKAPAQSGLSYAETLASVLEGAEPLVNSGDLSATERNMVTANLFEATSAIWAGAQANSQKLQRYSGQGATGSTATPGGLLNTEA